MSTGGTLPTWWNGFSGSPMLVSENTHVYMLGQGTDFYRYDTGTQVWTQLTNLPMNVGCSRLGNCNGVGTTNAYLYGSVACNGRILLYSQSTLRIYNIATQTWTTSSLPNAANGDGMAGTCLDGEAYIISTGGRYMGVNLPFVCSGSRRLHPHLLNRTLNYCLWY